jgi:Tfp pilus assembly protein PilO
MNEVRLHFRYWVHKWGWTTDVGVVLILGSLLFYFLGDVPATRQLQKMAILAADMHTADGQRKKNWMQESPRAIVQTFYRSLPPETAIPDLMEKIFDAASDSDLSTENGEFKLFRQKEADFSRYQIILPVQGSYADIRKFSNRVLQEIPSVALDDIGFSREDVHNPEVKAQIRFTLYLRMK